MSILVYKQRFRHPNKKDTPGANYAHIRYIATRPRVLKNEKMNHGLFGKLEPGVVTEFEDWKDVAKLSYANSKKGIVMYRSVVSFAEDTAKELLLKDQKSWQRYIENHIMTIAEKNGIKRENLQWAAAVHGEKSHPHIHVVFWDKSVRVKNPFTPPQIPNAIRKQMIKDTFAEKILAFAKEKDLAVQEMRRITDELVEEFEEELRCKSPGRFQAAEKWFEEELEQGVSFDKKILSELSERLFALRTMIPEHGRIAYGFLPPESREKTDELVQFLLLEIPEIRKCFERYVDAKCSMADEIPITPRISADGLVHFCQLFSDEKYAVGSIKESNTVDIFKSNQCNELIDFFRLGVKYMNGCDKCVWKSSCGRGCIALCVSNGSIQETDGNCYLRKKQLLSDLK